MLTTSKKMLLDAQTGGYAVGAFNIENMEMAQAVIRAAEELKSPVILQTTPSTVRYGSLRLYSAMVAALAGDVDIPVAMHLDHGDSHDLAAEALNQGYTSVMIDGSHSSFEDNISLTRGIVEIAKLCGIPVEAELGKVGGKEDDLDGGSGNYTDPQQAKEFIERTGVSSLAVAIGTAHGIYSEKPVLDIERLKMIRNVVDIPLILHGASGLSEEQIHECIKHGICKVNFATELRRAYKAGLDDWLSQKSDAYDPKAYGKVSRESVKQLVTQLINICGCAGKAS